MVIASLNPMLRGWFEYCKHSRRRTFRVLDGRLRRRLRSLLRKRQKIGGIAKTTGADQVRWPIAVFTANGLFSLQTAHETACQSSRR